MGYRERHWNCRYLGLGCVLDSLRPMSAQTEGVDLAINMSLAFCMGTDLEGLLDSPIGQPMAQIFLNSFGQKGTLALWSFVVLVQYMMGSSMVSTFWLSE